MVLFLPIVGSGMCKFILRLSKFILVVVILLQLSSFQNHTQGTEYDEGFKQTQLSYSRVSSAYDERIDSLDNWLLAKNLPMNNYEILFRAFKKEELLEIWVRGYDTDTFSLFKTYKVCVTSGFLGPKRKQGDRQIPEGVYYINEFNPVSNYHLSLGINYPNKSDSILGVRGDLGGDIFIHGGCESIGCLPLTTKKIKEVYILAMQARYFGQKRIPVHIFPCKLTVDNYRKISQAYNDATLSKFWGSLRSLYVYFESFHTLPVTRIDSKGKYFFTPE